MSRCTTLPFMDVVDEWGPRDDWFRLYCELCEYQTSSGSFHNCEMDAAEHLDLEHGEERRRFDAERLEAWRRLKEGAE